MQRKALIAILIAAVFLMLPLASAEWKGRGFYEPDTARDRTDGFMWQDPDISPTGSKVYFSAYSTMYPTPFNPNSGTTGSHILQYPTDIHAILGVWKDCNKDGYIGFADGAFADYPAAAGIHDAAVCPAQSVDPTAADFTPVHNDGMWVRELLVIAPDYLQTAGAPQGAEPQNNTYAWNIPDESARVWADWDLPESGSKPTCLALPGSRGNLQSTGGFLRWADCLAQWRITGHVNLIANTTGVQAIAFHDAPKERPDQSGSILNQPNPWGQESDASLVTAFDCSNPIIFHDDTGLTRQRIDDPTGGELSAVFGSDDATYVNLTDDEYNFYVSGGVGAPAVNPGGSAAGTMNETGEGAGFAYAFVWGGDEGTCDRDDDDGGAASGQIYELQESDQEANPAPARVQTGIWFEYQEPSPIYCGVDSSTSVPSTDCNGNLFALGAPVCTDETQQVCTPLWGGAWPTTTGHGGLVGLNIPGYWRGLPGYVASRNPYVDRESLQPWGAVFLSAYAHVDPNMFANALPSATTQLYGSAHCSGLTPTTGAFECDPDKWYIAGDGTDGARPFHVKVHQPYNLRDIDCYDQSPAKALGGAVSMSLVGAGVCHR